jgi:hypothetical protein
LTGSLAPGRHHRTPWARPKTFTKLGAWRSMNGSRYLGPPPTHPFHKYRRFQRAFGGAKSPPSGAGVPPPLRRLCIRPSPTPVKGFFLRLRDSGPALHGMAPAPPATLTARQTRH